ncbi:helix-turn-helix domain-containing protein [Methylomonas sp. 2BW1-5-20]|uniref:helix-turn-helix domain-containing protein n=1 Tax=Methylomonas sp. 2BW1-5-20 TaxID=3376686 RepID=UPI00404DA95C
METPVLTLHDINAKLELLLASMLVSKSVLSFEEAALYLGFAESYLYKLTSSQQIPFYKPLGKKLFFKREELDTWRLQNRTKTIEEINTAASDHVVSVKGGV